MTPADVFAIVWFVHCLQIWSHWMRALVMWKLLSWRIHLWKQCCLYCQDKLRSSDLLCWERYAILSSVCVHAVCYTHQVHVCYTHQVHVCYTHQVHVCSTHQVHVCCTHQVHVCYTHQVQMYMQYRCSTLHVLIFPLKCMFTCNPIMGHLGWNPHISSSMYKIEHSTAIASCIRLHDYLGSLRLTRCLVSFWFGLFYQYLYISATSPLFLLLFETFLGC